MQGHMLVSESSSVFDIHSYKWIATKMYNVMAFRWRADSGPRRYAGMETG